MDILEATNPQFHALRLFVPRQ